MAVSRKYYIKLPQMNDEKVLLWFDSVYNAGTKDWFSDLWEKFAKILGRQPKESEMVGVRCFGMYKTDAPTSEWKFIDKVLPKYVYRRYRK